jgi:hypothetical protein
LDILKLHRWSSDRASVRMPSQASLERPRSALSLRQLTILQSACPADAEWCADQCESASCSFPTHSVSCVRSTPSRKHQVGICCQYEDSPQNLGTYSFHEPANEHVPPRRFPPTILPGKTRRLPRPHAIREEESGDDFADRVSVIRALEVFSKNRL